LTDDGVGSLTLDAGAGHLGMATMRARADAEGGDLQIESVVDLGTVVTLSLPVLGHSDVATPTGGLAAPTRTELDFLRTVVVCDDHQYLRDAVKLVLSNVPRLYVVGEASDGPSCMEQVRYLRPDVLVLDVSMPGGGPQLAAAAKRLRPEMYIIVFSGRQDENVKNAMLAAGADQYLVKTGRLQPLAAALNSAMNSAQAHRSSRP
jgi:CheY-like chemotaxis protein